MSDAGGCAWDSRTGGGEGWRRRGEGGGVGGVR